MGDQEHDHAARLARFAIDAAKAASVRISPPACEFLIMRDARPSRVPLMPFHCPGQANCLLGNFVTIFDARPSKNPMNVPTPPPPSPPNTQTNTHAYRRCWWTWTTPTGATSASAQASTRGPLVRAPICPCTFPIDTSSKPEAGGLACIFIVSLRSLVNSTGKWKSIGNWYLSYARL